jgi:hypothetical protein
MDPQYDIYFAGEILDGHEPTAVRSALARLFKADDATLDKLFSGKRMLIKRGCDKATALKYKLAMENAGANPVIRQAGAPDEKAAPAPPPAAEKTMTAAEKIAALASAPDEGAYRADTPTATQTTGEPDDNGAMLAPAGADVLKPEERPVTEAVEVDTSGLAVDETAQRLSETPPPPPPAPDTQHLSMGEVGEPIPILDKGEPPAAPSTDHLDLSPSGTDFSDCAGPDPEAPELDLSAMEMAPPGSDVLEEQYRDRDKPPAPDTGHLSVED